MKLSFITPAQELRCPRFLRDFDARDCARAVLEITGLGLYRAFLNGRRVGDRYLTPGYNDYTAYLRCQTYDVTALMQAQNRLEVLVGDGWYCGRFGLDHDGQGVFGSQYLLAARLTVTHTDGSVTVLETDESWQASASAIMESGIYDGESRDDTRETDAAIPCVLAEPPCEPEPDDTPPIKQMLTLKPSLIVSPKGEQILDFGQNMVGVVRFQNRLSRGESLWMQFGEVLQDGCFYRDNLRSAKAEYRYVSDGEEKVVEPYFTFFGFRYAKVEGMAQVRPEDFTGVVLYSALKQTIEVETDSPKLNQLLQNALWGQRGNFVDVPTDCPQRDERLGWTGDTQVFVNTACYQMDCKAFYRKFMRDLRVDQTRYYGGDIPMYSPSLRGTAGHGGAVWSDAGTIVPWHVYQNYGDKELLADAYPMMRDYVEVLISRDQAHGDTHIVDYGFTFGDWLALDGVNEQAVKGGTDDGYIATVYYLHSVRLTANAAETLGLNDDAKRYRALAHEILAAARREYITPNGRLAIDSQTAYVLALYYGVGENKRKLVEGFRVRLRKDGYKLKSGFTGTPLMLPAMLDNGMVDEAYRILYNEGYPGWLYCVNLGATTIWERWNSLLPDGRISGTGMNSLNHYAYGSVAEAIYSRIAGLRLGEAGWKSARIEPQLNYRMKHIRLAFDSPAGRYSVAWRLENDGTVALEAGVPAGASAHIVLPDHPEQATFDVGEGAYSYRYTPTVDHLHPFSAGSIVADLLANAQASAILREKLPALYERLTGEDTAFAYDKLDDVAHILPFVDQASMASVDAELRQVRA